MVEVKCECGTRLRLADEWAGKQGRCPRCGTVLAIPALASPPPEHVPPEHVPPEPRRTARTAEPPPPDAERKRPDAAIPAPPSLAKASSTRSPGPADSRRTEPDRPSPLEAMTRRKPAATSAAPRVVPAPTPQSADKHVARARPTFPSLARRLIRSRWGLSAAVAITCGLLWGASWLVARRFLPTRDIAARSSPPSIAVNSDRPTDHPVPADLSGAADSPRDESVSNSRPQTSLPSSEVKSTESQAAPGDAASTHIDAKDVSSSAGMTPPRGLRGISREYDDLHCLQLQQQLGVRVPAAATIVEVDGERLPVTQFSALAANEAPILLLPQGIHLIRFKPEEAAVTVEIRESPDANYAAMRRFFRLDGQIQRAELLSRGARALDVHHAPFLLNFMGAVYIQEQKWEAAERKFRRALHVNPFFSPAHLNLAYVWRRAKNTAAVPRELCLAEAFNVGNIYGLAMPIATMRRELQLSDDAVPVALRENEYATSESLSVEDERMVALLTAMSKYATEETDRSKILNNLGVHFNDRGKPELALTWFRRALDSSRYAGENRFRLAKEVLGHMAAACRQAQFEEYDEYDAMQQAVLP